VNVAGKHFTHAVLLDKLKALGRSIRKKFKDFKSDSQELAVWRSLDGVNTLAVLPTGAGKSLSFQLPAFCTAGTGQLTLVISPLRALMSMFARLPGTVAFHSDQEIDTPQQRWEALSTGEQYVLLVSPEKLSQYGFQRKLCQQMKRHKLKFARFVVDEVHCLSDWGHDFRPHYWWVAHHLRTLERTMRVKSLVPRLLLTATADKQVIQDIEHHFPEIGDPQNRIFASVARDELFLGAREVDSLAERKRALLRFLKRQANRPLPRGVKRRGIVYNHLAVKQENPDDSTTDFMKTNGFLRANEVVDFVRKNGFPRTFPFASSGLKKDDRDLALRRFDRAYSKRGQRKLTVVVATSAFGMGMDYSKVPFVCHLYPRTSLSEYWQQVGRAGRDMIPGTEWAETLAIFSKRDANILGRFAKAPAVDGLVNVYTMPLHNWMYVWTNDGGEMSLRGKGKGNTAFSRFLRALQGQGIVEIQQHRAKGLAGVVRYRIHIQKLRQKREWLDAVQRQRFYQKKLRKVFRYLRITAVSRRGKWITLDQTNYSEDKAGTVLQRLNRWVDIDALSLDTKAKKFGVLRLRKVGTNLTAKSLRAIGKHGKAWAKHKRAQLERAIGALAQPTPEKRKQKILAAFGASPKIPPFPHTVPRWMR
jgi:superfamily II DNA or RNA helicase